MVDRKNGADLGALGASVGLLRRRISSKSLRLAQRDCGRSESVMNSLSSCSGDLKVSAGVESAPLEGGLSPSLLQFQRRQAVGVSQKQGEHVT